MMTYVWALLMLAGMVAAAARGQPGLATQALMDGAAHAVRVGIELWGLLAFWSGIMQIADDAGLTTALARALMPVARRLFPEVAPDSPALGAVLMSLSANMLGLGNAATPLGIKAMQALQQLNPERERASPSMCRLLALCTSSITLIPTSVIALRAASGAANPADAVLPTVVATAYSTLVALVADTYFRRRAALDRR